MAVLYSELMLEFARIVEEEKNANARLTAGLRVGFRVGKIKLSPD